MPTSTEILSWLGQATLAMGGAFGLFMIALSTKFGDKLIAFQFDKRLGVVKDAQNHEIEKLREQLSHLGDRGKRSNEMEFAAIKLVWDGFVEAYLATATCAMSFVEYPDFLRMSDARKGSRYFVQRTIRRRERSPSISRGPEPGVRSNLDVANDIARRAHAARGSVVATQATHLHAEGAQRAVRQGNRPTDGRIRSPEVEFSKSWRRA